VDHGETPSIASLQDVTNKTKENKCANQERLQIIDIALVTKSQLSTIEVLMLASSGSKLLIEMPSTSSSDMKETTTAPHAHHPTRDIQLPELDIKTPKSIPMLLHAVMPMCQSKMNANQRRLQTRDIALVTENQPSTTENLKIA
jgi:hypothetical protein